jgi:riboflavin kinase/FMN adenylyltransferase
MSDATAQVQELFRPHLAPCVVTLGVFDGLHRGHLSLLETTVLRARRDGLQAIAVTFSPRPEALFRGADALPDIWTIGERVARLVAGGIDQVVVLPFTRELAAIEARDFLRLLQDDLGMRTLCVGEEFALGRGRAGTVEQLRAAGVDVVAVPLARAPCDPEKLSSTTVRRAIAAGVPVVEAVARSRCGQAPSV